MSMSFPGRQRLVRTWSVLMILTAASMAGGLVSLERDAVVAFWAGALVIAAATLFKAHRIVMVYLNLRVSTAGWRTGFMVYLTLTALVVLGGYVVSQPGIPVYS